MSASAARLPCVGYLMEWKGTPVEYAEHVVDLVGNTPLVRLSSVAAGGATVDVEYPWHSIAQVWQTPGEGERYMEEELTPEVSVPYLVENGMPREYAERNSWLVPGNKDCILALYRSAVKVGEEWQPGLEQIELPSMVIWGRHDPYVELPWGERLAARMHAELVVLDCGHWWPFEQPRETADALQRLWTNARR